MLFIETSINHRAGAMRLVQEKITLPSQITFVSRPRLLALLRESLGACTSTILQGRAGSGKTILAVDFARKCSRAVSWYKVDAPDSDLEIFFDYLVSSIQLHRPGFGRENLLPLLRSADTDRIALLAEAFIYELLQGEHRPLLIVIEDLHLICDAEWVVPFFRRLLPLLPGDVHIVITSRTLPPAPLWRLRSKQSLAVIDEAMLAFTRQEATDLFESCGLSREQASIALDHTRGRAAALVTCAEAFGQTGEGLAAEYAAQGSQTRRLSQA